MKKIIFITLYFLIFYQLFSSPCYSQELNLQQKSWIKQYSQIYFGQQWKQWDKVMASLMRVESGNCMQKVGELDASFGCSQMKVEAVRQAAKYWKIPIPKNDDKIIWKLLQNDKFAIHLSTAYMAYLMKKFNDWDLSVISYNIGEGKILELLQEGKELPTEYLEKIKEGMENIK